jgi:hypothetical protein
MDQEDNSPMTTLVVRYDGKVLVPEERVNLPQGQPLHAAVWLPHETPMMAQGDVEEATWLRAASQSPSFGFLNDAVENVYGPTDGQPFHDER